MNFMSTVKGSALEGFYPAGWDFDKIDACVGDPETVTDRQAFWNKDFQPIACSNTEEFATYLMLHKYGAPPHGGLGLGLERLTMHLLGAKNVREATMFPRDINRVSP